MLGLRLFDVSKAASERTKSRSREVRCWNDQITIDIYFAASILREIWCLDIFIPVSNLFLAYPCPRYYTRKRFIMCLNQPVVCLWRGYDEIFNSLAPEARKEWTSNGSWCMGIKGEMSGTVCVTLTWYMYRYELFIAFVCFVVCSLL